MSRLVLIDLRLAIPESVPWAPVEVTDYPLEVSVNAAGETSRTWISSMDGRLLTRDYDGQAITDVADGVSSGSTIEISIANQPSGTGIVVDEVFRGDAYQPHPDDLRLWARSSAYTPRQDWMETISVDESLVGTFFELASQPDLPHQQRFLDMLYMHVASNRQTGSKALHSVLGRAENSDRPDLRLFAQRSRTLLAEPSLFVYQDWNGGLSRTDKAWPTQK